MHRKANERERERAAAGVILVTVWGGARAREPTAKRPSSSLIDGVCGCVSAYTLTESATHNHSVPWTHTGRRRLLRTVPVAIDPIDDAGVDVVHIIAKKQEARFVRSCRL